MQTHHTTMAVGFACVFALSAACTDGSDESAISAVAASSPGTAAAQAASDVAGSNDTMGSTPAGTTASSATDSAAQPTGSADESDVVTDTEPGAEMADGTSSTGAGSAMVRAAIADLRQMLTDPIADIAVVSVEPVTWPDSSVGCPRPGISYMQVLVEGSRIVLSHGGVEYEYHQGGGRNPFFCPPNRVAK